MNKNYCLNNQIQLIKSEIEKKIKECQEIFISSPDCFAKYQHIDGRIHAYTYILDFINSLPQEPITIRMEGFLEGLTSAKNNYQEGYMDGYSAAKKEIYKDLNDKMEKYHASQVIHIEMPKEPSEDLEEEIIHFNEWMKCNGLTLSTSTIAHYFANWGAEHL